MIKFFTIAGLLLTLGLPFAASAVPIVDWQTDLGGTPDAIADGLASTMSLDGSGLFGAPFLHGGDKFDDFVLNGQVFPEPTTALLLTLGLTGLGRFGNKAPPLAP